MKQSLLSLLFLTLLTSNGRSLHSATQPAQTATIAGWNILGFDPIPDTRVKRIARAIRKINPDLIVLSEVNPNDVPEKIVQELGADYQAPIVLPQHDGVIQNIALIFKTGVTVSDAQLLPETDLPEEDGSRQALTAKIRIGNFDFVLIGVHLKSGRTASSRAKRTRQCSAIADFIEQSVAGNEKDVLVLGDYNMIPRSGATRNDEANFVALSPTNFLRFVSSDFLSGRTSHISGCKPLRGNLLDGFAISRTFTREFIAGSTRMVSVSKLGTNCASFKQNISDHLPLVSEFRITTDDD
jgi:endonuclease/exonuclease/phosphatase family metal-dependent hydrolase